MTERKPAFEKVYEDRERKKRIPSLLLHVPSGIYYVRKFRAGKKELFVTTGTQKKGLAKTIAENKIAEYLGGKRVLASRSKTLNEVCDELEKVLAQEFENGDRRKRTAEKDQTYLPIIQNYFGDCLAEDLDEAYWEEWIRSQGKGLNRTLFDIAKYLSKVLRFAYQRKYIIRKPQIRNPDPTQKAGRVYENTEIQEFLNHADPLLKDLILLGAECGLRPHENLELRWEWVVFEGSAVILRLPGLFTKTKIARELEVSPQSAQVLRRRYQDRRESPFVFPAMLRLNRPMSRTQLGRLWRAMLIRAGKPLGLKFHWLRHSFYSKALLDAQLPIQLVSEYGGTSITTLQKRYLHSNARRTRMVSQVVKLELPEEKASDPSSIREKFVNEGGFIQ